jgi:Uma2 family endonuclease
MTTIVERTTQNAPAEAPATRHRFTAEEYLRMGEVGILGEDDRVELIEGEIIDMPPIGSGHSGRVDEIAMLITRATGPEIKVRVQNPIQVGADIIPQPDIAVLPQHPDRYLQALPTAQDVLLLIEVSESPLTYDRDMKMPLYARAGIVEAWIVNPAGNTVEMYTRPVNGIYSNVRIAQRGEMVTPTGLPQLTLKIDDILL